MPSLPKMAAFDLDGVLLDTSSSKEAYTLAEDLSPETALHVWNQGGFVHLDQTMEDAVQIVRAFENKGYTVAYITARRYTAFDRTVQRLTELGFPVNEEFLFMKPTREGSKPEYKQNILASLMETFDVDCFVDDCPENAEVAINLGIDTYSGVCMALAQKAGTILGGSPP